MQRKRAKNRCTTGVQGTAVRWGSNWGEGGPHGQKKVQVVKQRTERPRKWEEKGRSESKSKGHWLRMSTAQRHVPRDGSREPVRKFMTQVRKKQISLLTRRGMILRCGDRGTIPLGITRVRKCRSPARLIRVSVNTPDFRVKKHKEDSWLPRAREDYCEESLGFFSVILSPKRGRKSSNN